MPIDIPIVALSIYAFVMLNFYGWGMLHDQRFIAFALLITLGYLLSSFLQTIWSVRLRIFLLVAFIVIAVFGTTASIIQLRQIAVAESFINDSGLQVEIAGRFLLLGKNPYSTSYQGTDLAKWPYKDEAGNTVNPALFHNAYPPITLLLSAAGFRVFSYVLHWFDIRLLYLPFYIAILAAGYKKFGISNKFAIFLALVGINPLFTGALTQGSNDVVVIAFLVWSLFFLDRKQFAAAGILLGLGVATKQVAWIALPFYIYAAWRLATKDQFLRFCTRGAAVSVLLYLPFLLWNARALWESLVLYLSGSLPTSYPIHSLGFGMLLVSLGKISSIYEYYPFWVWQVAIGVPFFWLWTHRYKDHQLMGGSGVFVGVSVLLFIVWFFNRFMSFSYLGVLSIFLGLAWVWDEPKKQDAALRRKNVLRLKKLYV